MPASAREIRDKVASFVAGEISLRQFEEWFVPATWNIHRENNPSAEALADAVDLNVSEYTDGLLSREELNGELENAIRSFDESKPQNVLVDSSARPNFEKGLPPSRKQPESEKSSFYSAMGYADAFLRGAPIVRVAPANQNVPMAAVEA